MKKGTILNLTNAAALSAFIRGDFKNAAIASAPGGIEAQEAAGQATLVASQAMLPKQTLFPPDTTREMITKATGIQYHDDNDDLFVNVSLPPGWKIVATNHNMWSDLLDENGSKRAGIFYKAAFYDRCAEISFNPRYLIECDYAQPTSTVLVKDQKTKKVLMLGTCDYKDYNASNELQEKVKKWLNKTFPDYQNPFTYWDQS